MQKSPKRQRVLEVLMDESPRTIKEIMDAGADVLELGSVMKIVRTMADDGLLCEIEDTNPSQFDITDDGRAAYHEHK